MTDHLCSFVITEGIVYLSLAAAIDVKHRVGGRGELVRRGEEVFPSPGSGLRFGDGVIGRGCAGGSGGGTGVAARQLPPRRRGQHRVGRRGVYERNFGSSIVSLANLVQQKLSISV